MSQENNFIPSQESYKPLSPFHLFVKSNFPFIENTYEALDNYGLYCKVVEYLNTVIENENTVESNVGALYNAFVNLNTYVSDYFDNLDVQEEINNKLDEMVTTGQLQTLVNNIFTELDDKINSVASGSPAGVYPTESDLIAADPSHDKIYLVTSSGQWYYYNTTTNTWTSGGVYQSSVNEFDNTLTGNNQVANSKSIGDRINQDYYQKNLFTLIDNNYYNAAGVLTESTATFCTKEPIELKQGDTLYYQYNGENKNNVISHIIKCDNLGHFISRVNHTQGNYIADEDCFVLLNFQKASVPNYGTLSTLSINQPLNSDTASIDFYSSNKELSNINKKNIDDISTQYNYFNINESFINGNLQSNGIYLKRADNDFFTTNLIECKNGDTFSCAYFGETTTNYVLFQGIKYDSNKRFIERVSINNRNWTCNFDGYIRFNIPKGADDDLENYFVLSKNEPITRYYPYRKYPVNAENTKQVSIGKLDANNYLITFGLFSVLLFRTVNQATNQDNWNLKEIKKGNNVIVPTGTDILGPVKINDNTDFIGGVHGDETTNSIKISIDGNTYDLSDITSLSGNSITILMKSSVYDQIAADKAFDRYVTIIISGNKIHVSNNYTAAKNLTLKRATNGGLIACQNPIIKNIMFNNYYFDTPPTTQQSVNSNKNIFATITTLYGSISVRNIIGHENSQYSGYLNVFTNESPIRNKIYFDTYKESSYNFTTRQQINGEFEYILS